MALSAADLKLLIETCDAHRVTRFKAGGVEITFSGYRDPAPQSQTAELAEQIQSERAWMDQIIPPPPPAPEVE